MINAKQTPSRERRLRMDDVAQRAGVSQMTVSRALRTPEKVAPATRARIEAAMKELDYVPDLVAGSLAARRSGLIAAVISTFEHAVFSETIAGLTDCVTAGGFSILLGSSDYSTTDEERLLRAILGRRPDGVVLTNTLHTAHARRLLTLASIPVVETWHLPEEPVDMAVGFDNFEAVRAMTLALFDYGYRRIGYVGSAVDPIRNNRGLQRLRGYRHAMSERGLSPREVFTPHVPARMEDGASMLDELLSRFADTDAIYCSVDALAAGIVFAARARGIDVPRRLAVAGLGDYPIARPAALDLTTIRVAGREMGRRAGELLLARLRGEEVGNRRVDVGFEIVRRGSA